MTFEEVEKARQLYYQKLKKFWIFIAAISIIVLIVPFVSMRGSVPAVFMTPFFIMFFALTLGIIIMTFATRKEAENYRAAYKAYFVEQNLRSVFQNLTYNHSIGIPKEFLHSTGMINTGDRFHSNDYASGKYKDVQFTQSDVQIEQEYTDSDGDTHYVTIFKGRFMIFAFHKKFNFKLELAGKKFRACKVPGKDKTSGRKMQKISTESSEFNKEFRIFGEDGFEAFYILDPAFMVKMQDISNHYKNKVFFGFIDNQLIIGLNDGKDSFEPPKARKPIDEKAENTKINFDIKIITDLVDKLSLDKRIFKS